MSTFAIISIIMSVLMTGAGIYAQHKANQQAIEQNNLNREDTQQFNAEEAEKARQANIDQYNLLYSPQAKVQQYKDAGLSPALMYSGGGAASAGGTTQMASAGMAGTPTINPIIPQSGLLDLVQQQTEIDKTKAEEKNIQKGTDLLSQQISESQATIKKIEAETNNTEVSTLNLKLQNDLLEIQKDFESKSFKDRLETITRSKELIEKNRDEAIERIQGLRIENSKKEELISAEIRRMNAEVTKLGKETLLIEAQSLVAAAQERLLDSQKKLTDQQTNELREKTRILTVQANKLEAAPWTAESSGWIDKLINIVIDGSHDLEEAYNNAGISLTQGIKNTPKWIQQHRGDRIGGQKIIGTNY